MDKIIVNNKKSCTRILLANLIVFVVGLFFILRGIESNTIRLIVWIVVIYFGIGVGTNLWRICDPRPYLVIDDSGIYFRPFSRIGTIPWSEIQGSYIKSFRINKFKVFQYVCLQLRDDNKYASKIPFLQKKISSKYELTPISLNVGNLDAQKVSELILKKASCPASDKKVDPQSIDVINLLAKKSWISGGKFPFILLISIAVLYLVITKIIEKYAVNLAERICTLEMPLPPGCKFATAITPEIVTLELVGVKTFAVQYKPDEQAIIITSEAEVENPSQDLIRARIPAVGDDPQTLAKKWAKFGIDTQRLYGSEIVGGETMPYVIGSEINHGIRHEVMIGCIVPKGKGKLISITGTQPVGPYNLKETEDFLKTIKSFK